jgi:tetratricopeptide (TPR) repeat protein
MGELAVTHENLVRKIKLCPEIEDALEEASGRKELGRLLAYCGAFEEAEKELRAAQQDAFERDGGVKYVSVVWAYRALRAMLMDDSEAALAAADRALKAALEAEEQAGEGAGTEFPVERDIVRADWLLGAAHRAQGALDQADCHLVKALRRCRRINLVDHEPDILLALARLQHDQGLRTEARSLAEEALTLADRFSYRLVQADCHNVLARLALEEGAVEKARGHAETARERAWCDGPPHRYEVAFQEAERLLTEIEAEESALRED